MKIFINVLVFLFSFSLFVADADAKRMGGGKSYGKSYKTAPAPAKQETANNGASNGTQNGAQNGTANGAPAGAAGQAAASSSKKGLIGGLLAGGLLAALFMGGAFEGLQIMDMVLMVVMGVIAFMLIKTLLKKKTASPAYRPVQAVQQGGSHYQTHQPQPQVMQRQPMPSQAQSSQPQMFRGGFAQAGAGEVPFNYPVGFNQDGFLSEMRSRYHQLQDAWTHNDLDTVREQFSPELFAGLAADRAQSTDAHQGQILFVRAEIVRAETVTAENQAQISVKFVGNYKETPDSMEEPINDIWHLERDLTRSNAPWILVGIE